MLIKTIIVRDDNTIPSDIVIIDIPEEMYHILDKAICVPEVWNMFCYLIENQEPSLRDKDWFVDKFYPVEDY